MNIDKELIKKIGISTAIFLVFTILLIAIPGMLLGGLSCNFFHIASQTSCSSIGDMFLSIYVNGIALHLGFALATHYITLIITIILFGYISWIISNKIKNKFRKKRFN